MSGSKIVLSTRGAVGASAASAAAMIAHQVGAKATRDALFLSSFDVTELPKMVILSALLSIGTVLISARLMASVGPRRLVPVLFVISASLEVLLWSIVESHPHVAAIAIYLHVAILSAVLVSGFWSVVNERFDPRTARKSIARIGGGATFGGLVGGLMAERVAVSLGLPAMLLVLAGLHLSCGLLVYVVGRGVTRRPTASGDPGKLGVRTIFERPYLRDLALLVSLGTLVATLLDYVFKAQASQAFPDGDDMLRFFALFYSAVGLVTFIVQMAFSRTLLDRLGLAGTTATLPVITAGASIFGLIAPGIVSAGVARGLESVLRSSAFRSGYELFFTPVPPMEKRAVKSIVDVAFDKAGDAVGAGLIALVIFLAPPHIGSILLGVAVAVSVGVVIITIRLHGGYVRQLESSLRDRADELDIKAVAQSAVLRSIVPFDIEMDLDVAGAPRRPGSFTPSVGDGSLSAPPSSVSPPLVTVGGTSRDREVLGLTELRSGDAERVRAALEQLGERSALTGAALHLLAWHEVAEDVVRSLRPIADRIVGQLLDCLLDPDEEFTIRRRIPRILCHCSSPRAVRGLISGLKDRRFEVRFQCGRALAIIQSRHDIQVDHALVYESIRREVTVDRRVWESQRLFDDVAEDDGDFVDSFLRHRTRKSLQHVFTLLSLPLETEPLQIAFRGLHTDDKTLRGTALEYLESVLPDDVRDALWPFIEDDGSQSIPPKSREEILADLQRSHATIMLKLNALKEQLDESGGDDPS